MTKISEFMANLRAGLDGLGADEADDAEAVAEISGDEAEEAEATEQLDADPDAAVVDADAEVGAAEAGDELADETTPGGVESGDAEMDQLRAKIVEQAAQLETYRNALAELNGDPDLHTEAENLAGETDTESDALDDESDDTPDDEAAIAAYDADYAVQEAKLAELKKED